MSETTYSYVEEFYLDDQLYAVTVTREKTETEYLGTDERDEEHTEETTTILGSDTLHFYLSHLEEDHGGGDRESIDIEQQGGLFKDVFSKIADDYDSTEYSPYEEHNIRVNSEFELHVEYEGSEYILTMTPEKYGRR